MLIGNSAANILVGLGGNDTLNGKGGADTMIGGTGDDYYYVDNAGDKVVENVGEGADFVYSSVDYTLPANVERLILTDGAIKGTGNQLDNRITGNVHANTLVGNGGNDMLDGGAGADKMSGGTGNDTYYVDNSGDKVIENANEGKDTVIASVDHTLAANVENLTLTGNAVRGTGNDLANTISGNGLANILSGGGGDDILRGNGGNDVIKGGAGNDTLTGGDGHDSFVFTSGFGRDTITDFDVDEDHIDWTALGSLGAPKIKDSGHNVVVSFGADSITLLGVSAADLSAHHVFG